MNKNTSTDIRVKLSNQFHSSISAIFTIAVFTLVNLVLLVSNSGTYFLFSAYIPYILTYIGMMFCGMLPAEHYGPEFNSIDFFPGSLFAIVLGISILILAVYALCGFFGRKGRLGWLIVALVFFAIDSITLVVLNGINMAMIMDYIFHIWALVSIIMGISSMIKFKKLPPEEIVTDEVVSEATAEGSIDEIITESSPENN